MACCGACTPQTESRPLLQHDLLLKFLIVGDSATGKTCLLLQLTGKKFEPTHIFTIGVEVGMRKIEIDGNSVRAQIWDTAGQERFRSVTQSFFRGYHGAFILYDVTRRDTFDHLVTWLEDCRKYAGEETVLSLVGNKCDLEENREVSVEEGRAFAQENGLGFWETSAKTAENVEKAFVASIYRVYGKKNEKPPIGLCTKKAQNCPL